MNLFARLKAGLSKTRNQIASIVGETRSFDDGFYTALEDALIAADIGVDLTTEMIDRLRTAVVREKPDNAAEVYAMLKKMLAGELKVPEPLGDFPPKPWVVLVVGVNGTGKTTTIGKLAAQYAAAGRKVMLAAADTFRAAAIEQLGVWAERSGAELISQHAGADPASVAFDAMEAAKARGVDVLILDTAGRLHNKANLMAEVQKIVRVVNRNTSSAPNETLLVLDATTGQNALRQAEVFHEMLGLTGLVITKLDGTAKGGMALSITRKLRVPIRKIGVGEGIEDLQDFNAVEYVEAMFGDLEKA